MINLPTYLLVNSLGKIMLIQKIKNVSNIWLVHLNKPRHNIYKDCLQQVCFICKFNFLKTYQNNIDRQAQEKIKHYASQNKTYLQDCHGFSLEST